MAAVQKIVRTRMARGRFGIKELITFATISLFVFVVGMVLTYFITQYRAEHTIASLIAGDHKVEIVKIDFGGEPTNCVVCENVEVCRYLSEVLRTSGDWVDPQRASRGWQVTLTFNNGLKYSTTADLIPNGISMSIRSEDPVEIGIPTHTAYFHDPVPKKVQQMWEFLFNYPGVQTRQLLIVPRVGLPYETHMVHAVQ